MYLSISLQGTHSYELRIYVKAPEVKIFQNKIFSFAQMLFHFSESGINFPTVVSNNIKKYK